VQNLSPTAHTLHLHGMPFKVINVANYTSCAPPCARPLELPAPSARPRVEARPRVCARAGAPGCGLEHSSCFLLPWWDPESTLNKCPRARRKPGDARHKNIELGGYWGCTYDAPSDAPAQNLRAPLLKDSFQLWQRSWAVLRFEATRPGFWYLHCHETQHLMLGLQTVFNVLPSQQPPVPADVPTSGAHFCPTVNEAPWGS
jgi:FtsP/CotA-like multicopper oxidase with cupredoxin domain